MNKQPKQSWETVEYTDNPELPDIEDVEIVADFLPPPEGLVFKGIESDEAFTLLMAISKAITIDLQND